MSVFILALFTSMSGYAFAKLKIVGKNFIYWGIISLLAMPTQIFIIPLFIMFSKVNLIDNFFGITLIYVGFRYAFGTFLMKSFYQSIPDDILDSAKIDGANNFQIYTKIMLPLGKPAITTLVVINFFSIWNELFISMIFNRSKNSRLITSGIALYQDVARVGSQLTNWPLIFTGMILSLVIPFIVYFLFQNKIASGLTVGAIKE